MKKIIISGLVLMGTLAFAQTGNVGINTATPVSKLHVVGATSTLTGSVGTGVTITASAISGVFLETTNAPEASRQVSMINTDSRFRIQTRNSAGTFGADLVGVITQAGANFGFVGIGLENPEQKLDVDGNARIRALIDGANIVSFPYLVTIKEDGTLGKRSRQATLKTTLVNPGTAFGNFSTISTGGQVEVATGAFTSTAGGNLHFIGDGQMSVTAGGVTVGFQFYVNGILVDEVRQYFASATKIGMVFNFIIPNIAAGNHTWQLRINGNTSAGNNSFVDANHRYQLKLVEVPN